MAADAQKRKGNELRRAQANGLVLGKRKERQGTSPQDVGFFLSAIWHLFALKNLYNDATFYLLAGSLANLSRVRASV